MVNKDKLYLSQFTRSQEWPKIRRAYLRNFDACAVCNTTKRLSAHHLLPFQLYPESELDMKNLITLCPAHHLFIGHLGRWASFNINAVEDAAIWKERFRSRPNKMRYPRVVK